MTVEKWKTKRNGWRWKEVEILVKQSQKCHINQQNGIIMLFLTEKKRKRKREWQNWFCGIFVYLENRERKGQRKEKGDEKPSMIGEIVPKRLPFSLFCEEKKKRKWVKSERRRFVSLSPGELNFSFCEIYREFWWKMVGLLGKERKCK